MLHPRWSALVNAAPVARLDDHRQLGVSRNRMVLGPPARGISRPRIKGEVRSTRDGELQLERLHRPLLPERADFLPASGSPRLSARSLNRAAASPHTRSK